MSVVNNFCYSSYNNNQKYNNLKVDFKNAEPPTMTIV